MVKLAYNVKNIGLVREYFIPKPFDNRLLTKVSIAVAKAAMKAEFQKTDCRFPKNTKISC